LRPEEILPDDVNRGEIDGVSIRKGSVGAFLANARILDDPTASAQDRDTAERDLLALLPAHARARPVRRVRHQGREAARARRAAPAAQLERNPIRWNRARFHLIGFARTGDVGFAGHNPSS
jgi:hypothetical protein